MNSLKLLLFSWIILYITLKLRIFLLMATVNFLYRSTRPMSTLTLRLLFRHNGNDYVQSVKTKIEVTKVYWEQEHKRKRLKDIELINLQADINSKINNITNHVLSNYNQANPNQINKQWLVNCIEQYYNPQDDKATMPTYLIEYFDYFLETKKREITESSIRKYGVVRNLLFKYQSTLEHPLKIVDVDFQFKHNFETFCEQQKYSPNTIAWAIKSIKTVCNHAKLNGLETNIQLDNFKTSEVSTPKIYLSFEELNKIESLLPHDLGECLNNARDWLIISCYTGQRISDFMRFSPNNIRSERGHSLLEFTQHKTKKIMTIPLHDKVLAIIDKRNGEFPRPISSQKYNDYIKEVCKLAELNEKVSAYKRKKTNVDSKFPFRNKLGNYEKWELVSSHIGRRSFATNFYGEIPTPYLTNMTGHSTEQMFLKYIGKSNKDIALEMFNYFDNTTWNQQQKLKILA